MIFIREAHPSPNLCQIQYTPGANKWFIEARNIHDGIITDQQRDGCCTLSRFWKRRSLGKHVAASRFVKKNDFTCTPCIYSREGTKPMSASQERQPTLDSIAPRSLVADMEQALAFYGQLGFAVTYQDEGFA